MNGSTSGQRHPRWRAGVLAAAAAGITVFAAGCGSSGNGAPASPAPAAHPLGHAQYHGYSQSGKDGEPWMR
jgi:hypothetical protein